MGLYTGTHCYACRVQCNNCDVMAWHKMGVFCENLVIWLDSDSSVLSEKMSHPQPIELQLSKKCPKLACIYGKRCLIILRVNFYHHQVEIIQLSRTTRIVLSGTRCSFSIDIGLKDQLLVEVFSSSLTLNSGRIRPVLKGRKWYNECQNVRSDPVTLS